MSHTGVKGTGWRRAARSNGESADGTARASQATGLESTHGGVYDPCAMAYISGKQAFLEVLVSEGVSVMFGNPGTTELPLMDGLAREPRIRYVLALQEAVAIAMADGYAQASGSLAAVNVHVSPGLGNAMGMLYDAFKAGSPLLLTAGQHDQSFTVTEPILWSDLPPVAAPYVKWSTEARRLEDLPRIVRRAVKTALAQPRGPVFLSLPVDVLNAEQDLDLMASTRVAPRIVGDRAAIDAAARKLVAANTPLFVVGDAVAHGDALAEMVELAELIGAPVMLEGVSSTCSFPFTHPLYAGSMPRLGPQIRGLLMRHDLLFSVGGDLFTLSLPSDVDPMPHGLDVVHLDVDPWEIGKNYPASVAIQGDPKATLPELCEAVRRHAGKAGHKDAARRRDSLAAAHARQRQDLTKRAGDEATKSPMGPLALVHAVSQAVPDDVVVIDEAISSAPGIRNFFRCADPKSFFGLRGGGIGWGLPAALGVKLALPSRPVVALIGDGSAMYTAQALWTAAHESLAVVYVIFNNASYRILKERTKALKGFSAEDDRYVGMDLERPLIDYVGLARSLGVAGERVEKAADVGRAVASALASGGPALIDVRIDPAFN
jgi:benzoylformate decarboxylase